MKRNITIKEMQREIEEFASRRGWNNDDPNQLIASTMIEFAELAEYYQWKSKFEKLEEEEKTALSYEFVDVIFYLFQIANKSNIDLSKAFSEKLPKLERKFPIGKDPKKANAEYRANGKNRLYD